MRLLGLWLGITALLTWLTFVVTGIEFWSLPFTGITGFWLITVVYLWGRLERKKEKKDWWSRRVTLIIGSPLSGKTRLAERLAKGRKSVMLDGRNIGTVFSFDVCEKDTEVVIIDDMNDVEEIVDFISDTLFGFKVEKQGKEPFFIEPEIIITVSGDLKLEDFPTNSESFKRKVKFIELMRL